MAIIQAHDFGSGADSNLAVTGATNATAINSSGEIAATTGQRITHDAGTGANPRLLLGPAVTQYMPSPADPRNWGEFGGTLTDLGQDGIFRKVAITGNGSSWHGIAVSPLSTLTIAVGDFVSFTLIYDPTSANTEGRFILRTTSAQEIISLRFALDSSGSFINGVTQTFRYVTPINSTMSMLQIGGTSLRAGTIGNIRYQTGITASDAANVYGLNVHKLDRPALFMTDASSGADSVAPLVI